MTLSWTLLLIMGSCRYQHKLHAQNEEARINWKRCIDIIHSENLLYGGVEQTIVWFLRNNRILTSPYHSQCFVHWVSKHTGCSPLQTGAVFILWLWWLVCNGIETYRKKFKNSTNTVSVVCYSRALRRSKARDMNNFVLNTQEKFHQYFVNYVQGIRWSMIISA